jgi:hypothetical protein
MELSASQKSKLKTLISVYKDAIDYQQFNDYSKRLIKADCDTLLSIVESGQIQPIRDHIFNVSGKFLELSYVQWANSLITWMYNNNVLKTQYTDDCILSKLTDHIHCLYAKVEALQHN